LDQLQAELRASKDFGELLDHLIDKSKEAHAVALNNAVPKKSKPTE
jgi:hypothetical protein